MEVILSAEASLAQPPYAAYVKTLNYRDQISTFRLLENLIYNERWGSVCHFRFEELENI